VASAAKPYSLPGAYDSSPPSNRVLSARVFAIGIEGGSKVEWINQRTRHDWCEVLIIPICTVTVIGLSVATTLLQRALNRTDEALIFT